MFAQLANAILHTQDDFSKQTLFNALYDYLCESDEPTQSDIIFVFGSKSTFRIEKAVKLYREGYASRVCISGRGPFYEQELTEISEAEKLAAYALAQGVPAEALIIEAESITVPDNVKRSLSMLEQGPIAHNSFILVNSPFSQRRGWAHFQKMSEPGTRLVRNNTDRVSEEFSRDRWYHNETGTKIVLKEFFGLRVSELLNTS